MTIRGRAAVVGIAEVDTFQTTGRSPAGIAATASQRALGEAGLSLSDVDGLFTTSSYYSMPTLTMSESLGI